LFQLTLIISGLGSNCVNNKYLANFFIGGKKMIKVDIDQILDCSDERNSKSEDFPIILVEIDKLLKSTCDW
jgi:hypothetical protein